MSLVIRTIPNFLCLAVVAVSCARSQQSAVEKLVGEWQGTGPQGKVATFIFRSDGTMEASMRRPESSGEGEVQRATWTLDANHDPMHLDIKVIEESSEGITVPMILKFVSDDEMVVRVSAGLQSRPTEFDDSDDENQVRFIRQ